MLNYYHDEICGHVPCSGKRGEEPAFVTSDLSYDYLLFVGRVEKKSRNNEIINVGYHRGEQKRRIMICL